MTLTAKNLVSRTLASFLQSYGPQTSATAFLKSSPIMQKLGAILCCKDNSICSTVLYGSPITKAGYLYSQEPKSAHPHFSSIYPYSTVPPYGAFTAANGGSFQIKQSGNLNRIYQQSDIYNNDLNLDFDVQEQPIMTTSIHEEESTIDNPNTYAEYFNLTAYYIPKINFNPSIEQKNLSSDLNYDAENFTAINDQEVIEQAAEQTYITTISNSPELEKNVEMYAPGSAKNSASKLNAKVSSKSEPNSIKRVKDYLNK